MTSEPDRLLYTASVPVLRAYLARLGGLLERVTPGMLAHRVAEDMFSGAEQVICAQGFALRTVCPVLGRAAPDLGDEDPSRLRARNDRAAVYLATLKADDFQGAAARSIQHDAGQANLRQSATDYVLLFALPNFFFHLTAAYTTLRAAGAPIGKADFDGLHAYAPGFRF